MTFRGHAIRLVPHDEVPRALAIVSGGNALATVLAAPLGSVLGTIMGWRGAPVGWWTWLAQTLPYDAEAGGGGGARCPVRRAVSGRPAPRA